MPLFAESLAPSIFADDVLRLSLGGEPVELHAARALYWPREKSVFVADVHLGKGAAFRAGGIPLPRGATANDLARLASLVATTGATRLVVLGDFLHAASGRVDALDVAFRDWRARHAGLSLLLVRGNHDSHAGDPPPSWGMDIVDEPHPLPPFLGCHHPAAPRSGYALCGHVHPGVSVGGTAEPSVRMPCFVIGQRRAILPAFGRLTGLAAPPLLAGDKFVAIAGRRLVRLPQRD
ncbi:MAG TPA: ligase-associated DNA damage response endonuclease PdeM [Casimicrobiaceae bacterium]|nr:ligase-associated DNA damage response endonuclease PdeM [Casimicrobiaceae bacterium]